MEFGIAIECDESSSHVTQIVTNLEDAVRSTVSDREYGTGLDHIYVGLILLPTHSDGHECRPFKFQQECIVRSPFGAAETLRNVASIDVVVDPQVFDGISARDQGRVITRALLSALDEIGSHRGDFPGFKFDELRADVARVLER